MTEPQPDPSVGDPRPDSSRRPGNGEPLADQEPSPMAGLAADYAARAGLHRTHDASGDADSHGCTTSTPRASRAAVRDVGEASRPGTKGGGALPTAGRAGLRYRV